MRKKRRLPSKTWHLWAVKVRHRDYQATMNSLSNTLYMKESTLWIESPQPELVRPDIEIAIRRAWAFLKRNQRKYGMPGILAVEYRGTIDK